MELNHETRARIFGLYIGCEVQVSDTLHGTIEGKLYGVHCGPGNNYGINYLQAGMSVTRTGLIHNCKLLLSPLEAITDEECIECYNIDCDPESVNGIKDDHKIAVVRTEIESGFVSSFAVADFLRSKYYHVPYGEVRDLFECGIAIDRTKQHA